MLVSAAMLLLGETWMSRPWGLPFLLPECSIFTPYSYVDIVSNSLCTMNLYLLGVVHWNYRAFIYNLINYFMEYVWFVVVGAVAGWLASVVMHTNNSIVVTIILGILGGVVGGWLFGLLGISLGGMIGHIIISAIGAVILVALHRMVTK